MKQKLIGLSVVILLSILSCGKDDPEPSDDIVDPNVFIDARDGQSYKTVVIGTQTWFAENLNYESSNSWDYLDDTVNGNIYGRLYNWDAANTACPTGWHLASDDEWKTLEIFLGMTPEQADTYNQRGEEPFTTVGKHLKSTSGWFENGNGDNSSGFSALPGGYRSDFGEYDHLGKYGNFWTSTEYGIGDWGSKFRLLYYEEDWVYRSNTYKDTGFSVRCLKD